MTTLTFDTGTSDSLRAPVLAGALLIALFFGGLGGWAAIAPLNAAVVANGTVKVEGNRKSVQHLDGGIVRTLDVKEGDVVEKDQVLLTLDDTQARAEFEVLSDQYYVLRATETRLLAELAGRDQLTLPSELAVARRDAVADIWTGQLEQFRSRRATLDGQRRVIGEKIRQLEAQIAGAGIQAAAYGEQIASVRGEAASVAPLVEKKLLPRPRLLQLERTAAGLQAQIADAEANIARAKEAIGEQELQSVQLGKDRLADVAKELHEVQARLLEVVPKRLNAAAVLGRTRIRAPYSGRVVGLSVFAVGGVIQRGEKILDIVPDTEDLMVEAEIAVEDISELHAGMPAEVRLTAYKQRLVPPIPGEVVQVSADRLVDPKTNVAHYVAIVRPDARRIAEVEGLRLYPGMPATVTVPTEARTALDYLLGPLSQSFHKAFRQR
jgi:HlyD family type I secretion membrane fusion protein